MIDVYKRQALYLHGLIDVIPKYKEVTVYTGYNPHRIPKEVKRHFIQKELYEVGVTKLQTSFGNEVRVYAVSYTHLPLLFPSNNDYHQIR